MSQPIRHLVNNAGSPAGSSNEASPSAADPISAAVLGWDENLRGPLAQAVPVAQATPDGQTPDMGVSRVAVGHRGAFELVGPHGHFTAAVEPGLRRQARSPEDFPAVGDWVVHELTPSHDRRVALTQILSRDSVVLRKAAGPKPAAQIVASNVDVIGVVTTAELLTAGPDNADGHRLERYLVAAAQGGVRAVLVVNKADLVAPDWASSYQPIHEERFPASAGEVAVLATSAKTAAGISELAKFASGGSTLALAGASGVGKSSLVNRLLGREALEVGPVSASGSGRHTTIRRELFVVPTDGPASDNPTLAGTVIDTPGLADLVPWTGGSTTGLDKFFADVAKFAQQCHFADCSHRHEPKCAVRQAAQDGQLVQRRLDVYLSLAQDLSDQAQAG